MIKNHDGKAQGAKKAIRDGQWAKRKNEYLKDEGHVSAGREECLGHAGGGLSARTPEKALEEMRQKK